jgi:hypothetical protein
VRMRKETHTRIVTYEKHYEKQGRYFLYSDHTISLKCKDTLFFIYC